METGSLYPALYRLEAKGWIAASWELSDKGKRARYYRITPKGRKQLAGEQSKWDAFARAMGLLLKPADEEATMTSLLRKVHVVAAAPAQGGRTARGAAVPSCGGSGRTPGRRAAGGRGQVGGPARPGQRDAAAGRHAHAVVVELLEQLAQDLRYGLRAWSRTALFTALAALSLALGIGANTAIYSFMDAILLRSLPVADPASLVVVKWRSGP